MGEIIKMKLTIPKKELKEALIAMSKIIAGRSALPIVNCVKIEGSEDGIAIISATNLEEHLTYIIKGCDGTGAFIIDLKELKDFLKTGKQSDRTVEIEEMGSTVAAMFFHDRVDSVKNITTYPEKDWPKLLGSSIKGKKISGDVFENIQKAIPCAANKDDTRAVLKSVFLEKDAVVATNGKELLKLNCRTGVKTNAILPITRFIQSKYFIVGDGTLSVEKTDEIQYCTFITDSWIYTSKCVFGRNYPNYKQVIPKTNECSITLTTETIMSLQKTIPELESDEEFETVHLYADDKQIKILPSNYTGKALTVDGIYKGNSPITASINRNLLLRSLELGFTKLNFTDGDGYAPILAKDAKGLYVFMPLKGVDTGKIKKAAKAQSKSKAVNSKHGSDKALEFHGKKPEPQGYTPVTSIPEQMISKENKPQQERSNNRSIKKDTVQVPCSKEDKKMPEETKNQGFHVVGESETDHFEELLTSIMEVRVQAKAVFDMTGALAKHVKDAQRAQKVKEREFKHTRDLLGKLKKVSGF
jgi:DNA polymerase III sliding clamp (beta) subunit (PCNA family)